MPDNPTIMSDVIRLAPGATHQFRSHDDVSWTCTGGHIEQNGRYTAGTDVGTYYVRASRAGGPTTTTDQVVVIGDGPVVPVKTPVAATPPSVSGQAKGKPF
jgi:hypothetical protein